jgi:formylglycine-generating enzyme required for sulfatase activity
VMQLPARIGKYELEEFLGGGMSEVYRARDLVIGRTVAVKILTAAGCADADVRERFLAEARMAGNISHENILSIYDFGEDEQKRPFMVMEFLRGETLRQAIDNRRTGDLSSKLKIAVQVARALEYVHTQKIIHRDIKPENVHINHAGVVKLMDFGIAKTEGLSMTRAGYVLGTPFYMAPEQVMGRDITPQVDVYAFGVLLFELISGAKPIRGETVERIFYSILNEPLNLEPLHQTGVPQSVCDLVARCTAKDPGQRPQGFGPICAELDRLIPTLSAPTVAVSPSSPAPGAASGFPKWIWVLGITLLLLIVGGGAYFAMRPSAGHAAGTKIPELARTIQTPTGEMVLVPAGTFLFGEKKMPVSLPAFYIDRTEVTNAEYAAFCRATGHKLPDAFPEDKPDYPVVNVTITDAHAYASWAGKRLPTTSEWEKAARGSDGRLYPWGDTPDLSRVNIHSSGPRPAADLSEGASPYGALQMVGNVWEFVEQISPPPSANALAYFQQKLQPPPQPNEPWYLIRGESFAEPNLDPTVLWDSAPVPGRWSALNLGFRCVRDVH